MGRIKSVSIVALGPSGSGYASYLMHELKKPTSKVWAINRAILYLRTVDMGIAMDDHEWMAKHEDYSHVREALFKVGIPIMTTTTYGLPGYVEYPLKKVLKAIPYYDGRYLDNSINYALALAITMKIKNIYLFGCDFQGYDSIECVTEKKDTIPNWRVYYKDEHMPTQCEPGGQWIYFLMGVAAARKLKIILPPNGTLAGLHRGPRFFYGFVEQPEI